MGNSIKCILALLACLLFKQLCAMSGNGDIQIFDPSTMDLAVSRIARDNIRDLTAWHAYNFDKPEEREKAVEDEIMVCARREPDRFRVLILRGEIIGFISYTFSLPWYRILIGSTQGANAMIHHLVIDERFRNQGGGSQLMQAAIDDCKSKGVNKIALWTNDKNLENFYAKKHGFCFMGSTKFLEHNFALRLRPHPLLEAARYVLKLFKLLPK